ncbi:DUF6932 family protein [Indiicoccus explosivorum]|uniref:DUF6932 family protein n=1 Tax=Indiicoccus explosivorum TaxID=1917864 RepID=UPI000B432F7D|nr:hypothetical protein [Indiicoccus explosivorum]
MTTGSQLQFDHRGNLTPGIIRNISLQNFKIFFVEAFPDSETRERNYEGFSRFIAEIKRVNIFEAVTKFWIDGSFVTNKEDPKDVDLVFYLDATHPATRAVLQNKRIFREFGIPLHCDPYFTVDPKTIPFEGNDVEEDRAHFDLYEKYWRGQFCFDRNEDPKGIIEMTIDQF